MTGPTDPITQRIDTHLHVHPMDGPDRYPRIYSECLLGEDAGSQYIIGNRRGSRNDRPIIPAYGVNDSG